MTRNKRLRIFSFLLAALLICGEGLALRPVRAEGVIAATSVAAPRFTDVVIKIQPAVVTVAAAVVGKGASPKKQKKTSSYERQVSAEDYAPTDDFAKNILKQKLGQRPRYLVSLGSGFIIDPSGLVVTNNHVIDGGEEIYVILRDGAQLKVEKVIGRDSKSDLTLLKVTPPQTGELAAVSFGNSDAMRVGDWVIAIGNPFGLNGTVTTGILSGKNRDINAGPYDDFLQTDASINRGNSGGPLFNGQGEVIGINTAIFSPSGGSIGLGFAIPSNVAKRIVDQLEKDGVARWGTIGVRLQTLEPDIAADFGVSGARGGVVIGRLSPGGAAERAGLRVGDILQSADGVQILNVHTLPRLVSQRDIGTEVRLQVLRDGAPRTVSVTVEPLLDKPLKKAVSMARLRAQRQKSLQSELSPR